MLFKEQKMQLFLSKCKYLPPKGREIEQIRLNILLDNIVNMLPCSGVGNALPQGRHVEADGHHLQEGRPSGRVLQEGAQVRDG